jgi:hypothetical protein
VLMQSSSVQAASTSGPCVLSVCGDPISARQSEPVILEVCCEDYGEAAYASVLLIMHCLGLQALSLGWIGTCCCQGVCARRELRVMLMRNVCF